MVTLQPWIRFRAWTALLILATLAACGETQVELPELAPPERFEAMDEVVQKQYSELKAALDATVAEGASKTEIAERLGNLGMWYQIYRFQGTASVAYAKAVSLQPGNPKWIFLNGVAMSTLGELEEAEQAFRKTLELDPTYSAAEVRLAETLIGQGEDDQLIRKHLESALAIDPNNVRAMVLLADRQRRAGQADQAVALLDRALQLQDSPQIHYQLGLAFRDTGALEVANAHLAKAEPESNPEGFLMRDPYSMEVTRMDVGYTTAMKRARQAMSNRNFAEALSQYRRASDSRANSVEARLGVVRATLALNRKQQAKTEADRLVVSFPNRPKVQFVAGRVYEAVEAGSGEPFFLKALELDGNLVQAMLKLADYYQDQGRLNEALSFLARARNSRPGHVEASPRYARMLIQMGKIEEAKRVLSEDVAVTESPGPLVVLMDELGMEIN